MITQNTLKGSQLEKIKVEILHVFFPSFFLPDTKHEADGQKDGICSSLLLLLGVVWHPALLQEEEDLDVDDRDHHQGKDELEYTRENCVP